MEQKQYLNISRLRDDDLPDFHVGDRIIVEEKIDGANFSFRYDAEKDQICSFSRRVELHAKNTLFGAWEWSQKLDKKKIAEVLGNNLIMFAEWLACKLCLNGMPVPLLRNGYSIFNGTKYR